MRHAVKVHMRVDFQRYILTLALTAVCDQVHKLSALIPVGKVRKSTELEVGWVSSTI